MCWNPTFQLFVLLLAAAAAVSCLYCTVPQALYFVANTIQESHSKLVWTTTLCVCRHSICVCCVCYGTCSCVWMCASLYIFCVLEPHIHFSFCFFCLLCFVAAAAVSSRLCHTVPPALKLHYVAATVQQESHITFVWTTSVRVLTLHTRGCDLCVL